MLFDGIERGYTGPIRHAEPNFVYLNRSARPQAVAIRATLEEWFSRYPEGETKNDLQGRFRSGDDAQYRSSFFELLLHELCRQLSCIAEPHPDVEGTTKKPDFLVRPSHGSPFYLEAAIVTDESDQEAAARARINAIYDSLERLVSPDFFVGIQINGLPVSQPPARQIRAFLAKKLASVDPDEITRLYNAKGYDALPRWSFHDQEWSIEFYPIPKRREARGEPGVRPIGAITTSFRETHTDLAIKRTLEEKAGYYGELDLPYVIAVDALTEFGIYTDDVMNALFGTEHVLIPRDSSAGSGVKYQRALDGLWTSPKGPRYTRVSCVLIAVVDAWNLPNATVCLYHNPWARYPYDSPLTNLPQAKAEDNNMKWLDGKRLGELLHLPAAWPTD
jgi:hypothetical protein